MLKEQKTTERTYSGSVVLCIFRSIDFVYTKFKKIKRQKGRKAENNKPNAKNS